MIGVAVVLLLAVAVYEILTHSGKKENILVVSGRVEANETELSARIPGRLSKVFIDDGVKVKRGDLIALIEDEELKSRKRETEKKIGELEENIRAAEFNLSYTTGNVAHGIAEAEKALSVAEARLRQAEAKEENAAKEMARYSRLREKGAVSEERYDSMNLGDKVAREEVKTASEDVGRAKISLLRAEDGRTLVKAKERELLGLRKALGQLREALTQIEITIGYAKISAPIDGVVLRKVAEPGEVVPAGGAVGVMINPADVYVKTYVPEKDIGRLRMQMRAEIFTDAYPHSPVAGFLCYISDKAEFTPKEVQSYEERVKQVFAVKVCFSEASSAPGGEAYYRLLKKGMPVDVKFVFEGKR